MNFTNRYTYVRNKVTYENAKLTTRAREITINGDVLRAYENFYNFKKNYATNITGLEASKVAFSLGAGALQPGYYQLCRHGQCKQNL